MCARAIISYSGAYENTVSYATVASVTIKLPATIRESEKIRFIGVGFINTAIDFLVLFVLASILHVPALIANIISTSCALAASYLLNKKAVFKDTDSHNTRQIILFVTVTLTGLWIIQGIVIAIISPLLVSMASIDAPVALLVSKCIATLFSLSWNYIWYSRVVFPRRNNTEK